METENYSNRSSKFLPYIIFGVNLIVVLYLFLANQESRNIISLHKNERKMDSLTIKSKEAQIDDLQNRFQKIIIENRAMGLTIKGMEASVKELEKLKIDVKTGKIPLSLLEKRISSIQKKFLAGQIKADSLLNNKKYLASLRDSFNLVLAKREDSLSKLMSALEDYEVRIDKIERSAELKAENIKVMIVNSRGSNEKYKSKYKAKVVKGIRVIFNLASNPIAKHCPRNFYLKVEYPNGELLRNDKDADYTCKQSVEFNNTKQLVHFFYEIPNKMKPGKYHIALYSDENKIGEEVLNLK